MKRGREILADFAAPFIIAFLAVIAAQNWLGSFDAEIIGDSASHYVSGMFVADLLRHGLSHPIERLRDFAGHYPLVGIGHWPPLYYGIEALWSILVPFDQRMLLLSAATAALVAASIYALVRPRLGVVAALFGASAFVLSPLVLSAVTSVMLDIAVAFGCLIATGLFAQFLRTGRALPAILFAVTAAMTLMTKGNAGSLVLMPLIAIAATRRFDRLRSPWLWIGIPIVLILAGPWYLYTHKMVEVGYRGSVGSSYAIQALATDLSALLLAAGVGIGLSSIGGAWLALHKPRALDPLWGSLFAMAISVLIFQSIVPAGLEPRYMIPAVPPMIALAALFICRIQQDWMRKAGYILLLLLLLPGFPAIPRQMNLGIGDAVKEALRFMPANNRALLIVAEAKGEGAAISELVRMRDPSSDVFAVRGVRLLGGGGYNNQDYVPRYTSLDQVAAVLRTYRIPLLLLRDQDKPDGWAHIKQVAQLVARDPDRFQLVWTGKGGRLYRLTDNIGVPGDGKMLTDLSAPHALSGGEAGGKQ
jgi:hypothetical protein